MPSHPKDLANHHCIIGQVGAEWNFREIDGSEYKMKVPTNLRIRGGDAYREAAIAGLGIAQATWWLFRIDFRDRNVVQILEDLAVGSTPIVLMFPAGDKRPSKVRAFIDSSSK